MRVVPGPTPPPDLTLADSDRWRGSRSAGSNLASNDEGCGREEKINISCFGAPLVEELYICIPYQKTDLKANELIVKFDG